jgi:hypothetical protein
MHFNPKMKKMNKRINQTENLISKVEIKTSLVDHAWVGIMGTDRYVNSSNSTKLKLEEVVNRCFVAHIVTETFQTPTIGSIDCPTTFSISCELEKY